MNDNIILRKMWQDNELIQLNVICCSQVAVARTVIYVSDALIDDLTYQIRQFIDGNIKEGLWANEDKGNDTAACVSLRFLNKDKKGHILIEVFMELNDGGDYSKHNSCFFVNTEYGLLMNFCENLVQLKKASVDSEIQLNA